MKAGYVNVFVSDFDQSLRFYRDQVGLAPATLDEEFGYASFNAGPMSFAFAKTDDQALVGRHTGVGFICDDIQRTYEKLRDAGVHFEQPPERQPWGGVLAMFSDPDGNIFYLDEGHSD